MSPPSADEPLLGALWQPRLTCGPSWHTTSRGRVRRSFPPPLTFDRRTWRPIIHQLDGAFTSIAIDLPAHGDSGGQPALVETVAERIDRLLHSLGIDARSSWAIDGRRDRRALRLTHPARRRSGGSGDGDPPFRADAASGRADAAVPASTRSGQASRTASGSTASPNQPAGWCWKRTRSTGRCLGYWDQVLNTEPAELQAWIHDQAAGIQVPCLAVFGQATDGERERLGHLPDAQVEEWAGGGHFVHLVDPGRFAAKLRAFVEHCDQAG